MKSRDRVEAAFNLDGDLERLLDYMQTNIPANKLVGIADALPQTARLLWGHFQQEPLIAASITCESQPVANELGLGRSCAGDGSEGAAVAP